MSILSLNSRAEQIVIQASTDKNAVRLSDLTQSVDEYRNDLDPDLKYMTRFTINVFAADEEGANVMDIGFMKGIHFESEIVLCFSVKQPPALPVRVKKLLALPFLRSEAEKLTIFCHS